MNPVCSLLRCIDVAVAGRTGNDLLAKFCGDLEASIVETIEAGFYTKDLVPFCSSLCPFRSCVSHHACAA